jgi:hemerythrin-like domain-containing protein
MNSPKIHAERPRRPPLAHAGTLQVLDRTHRDIVEMLTQLHLLIEKLEARGIEEGVRLLARDICTFFDATARPHHAAEEALVFPDLLGSGDPELVQHVRRLQQDHGWLEEDWLELAPQLRAVANGQSWYDIDILRSAVPVFTELYRDHIALEETVVYPASRRFQHGNLMRNLPSGK